MKHFSLCVFLLCSISCHSQKINVFGTYFTNSYYVGEKVVSILNLNSNNTFNYYENVDEGDVTSECLSSGRFSLIEDSLVFESIYHSSYNYDNVRNIRFVDFSDIKFKIRNSNLEALNLPKIAAGQNTELQIFSKFDFLKLDSLKSEVYSVSNIEGVLITFQKLATLSSSNFKEKKIFNITEDKYNYLLSSLQTINFFSLFHKSLNDKSVVFGCLEMFFGKLHFSVCGNYFSQELYDLLFRNILTD
ncbi:MAG: hypothetical protein ABIT58_00595 [Ferruginibacter sp.]